MRGPLVLLALLAAGCSQSNSIEPLPANLDGQYDSRLTAYQDQVVYEVYPGVPVRPQWRIEYDVQLRYSITVTQSAADIQLLAQLIGSGEYTRRWFSEDGSARSATGTLLSEEAVASRELAGTYDSETGTLALFGPADATHYAVAIAGTVTERGIRLEPDAGLFAIGEGVPWQWTHDWLTNPPRLTQVFHDLYAFPPNAIEITF